MKMNRYCLLLVISLSIPVLVKAQTGGSSVYNFLDFSYSSRLAGLGGSLISVHDDDPTLIMMNPSSIGQRHHTSLALNVTDYFTNTNYASALYAHSFNKIGSFAFEMRYVGYGTFTETDVTGMELGHFTAGDFAASVGWGRALDSSFSIGAALKLIYCGYQDYSSFGFAVDVAGTYYNSKKQLSLTLLLKNMGSELKPFTKGNYERVPFDIQFALSQRFKHLPVQYHISLHSLYKWDMTYEGADDPFLEKDALTQEVKYPSKTAQFFDNFFRHIVVGLEIIPVKYFSIQFAYNHNRHQEMKIPQKKTFAGFSYGIMINIKSIQFGFSRDHYATGAVPNNFSFALNFNQMSKLAKTNKTLKLERKKSK